MDALEIYVVCAPGTEPALLHEVQAAGFADPVATSGGVMFQGYWRDVWRANLELRCAVRVLVRIGRFMAFHLAQLDKRARKFPWGKMLRTDVPVRVQVTSKASKIYHDGAAAQRIERALVESHGLTLSAEAALVVKVRIEDNAVTLSLDSTGEALHVRGHKAAVGKAPMRENLAASFLHMCGYLPGEPVLDPMCGSGTFLIEAAEIAQGMQPGRSRSFAFETLANFDAADFAALKRATSETPDAALYFGSDRDQGAVRMATQNAERAGVGGGCAFTVHGAAEARPPEGPPGLVIVNPPYGARIGNKKLLYPLYGTLGQTLRTHFKGWRVGLVTSEPSLAKACDLPWKPQGPAIAHGGLKIWLWQTGALR